MDSSPAPIKRRGNACKRCRQQKIKCDGASPSCSNCTKVKADCIKTSQSSEHIAGLEQRIHDLESQLRAQQNATQSAAIYAQDQHNATLKDSPTSAFNPSLQGGVTSPGQGHIPTAPTPASIDSHIGPSQPLAHDVGLLSLGNSGDPKYLGPSSGVTFARLIHAVVPQAQGIPTALARNLAPVDAEAGLQPAVSQFPEKAELHYFENAYFDVWQPIYPFLNEEAFHHMVERLYENHRGLHGLVAPASDPVTSMDLGQCFLVLALGAQILESRVGNDFGSSNLYATAIQHIATVPLHDSLRGIQAMILLVLCSFSFPQGGNAWFLVSAIIASCLDLGLQRRQLRPNDQLSEEDRLKVIQHENLRSSIFWSGYSLERTLSVILGRPLTLRDEAIDIRFPGGHASNELDNTAVVAALESGPKMRSSQGPPAKRARLESTSSDKGPVVEPEYALSVLSFRFDRIVAEIKLMVYRVVNLPHRFPWPDNRSEWQMQVHDACRHILSQAESVLHLRKGRNYEHLMHSLTLKYHQCLMILYRPSPAFPEPSSTAMEACYSSAVEILRIHAEMNRFATLVNSWLTAHAVFTSGITMLYCLWMSPEVRKSSSISELSKHASACTSVLQKLGKTWSVADSARVKFEKLVSHTSDSLRQDRGQATAVPRNVDTVGQEPSIPPGDGIPGPYDISDPTTSQFEPSWDDLIAGNSLPGPDMIMDELGDMSTWFDLDWLSDINYGNISWP
ncbi:hypothetical protein PRZ48_008372 [Zasmidium cellare]|uniref:Zn(2)-C6 fungal-type domain-containing protein n=1 Tax=Zasmidium cellare TaxID=395010 RepID=A0ABR0EFZ7_ZASCE|nr:hypothetical protein PRZ48_008372 [Zasmidium cellare]